MMNRRTQSGNIFFALFGAVAVVGMLGASVMTFMKGPLSTSVKLTKMNTAENQMAVGAQVAVMATASQANGGDCDADGYVEPIEWRTPTTEPVPTNGGLIPSTLGMSKKDPWGTDYGYCVWNHGAVTSGSGCAANMLTGTISHIYPVVAIVSAGADKTFTTTCRSFAAADVNSDGDLLDGGDLEMVSKAADSDDDIIFTYTYEEATGASGGLWNLKSGDPTTAEIAKDIEVTGDATVSGTGSFTGGVILPDSSFITCDGTTAGVMAKNASGTGLEICDGVGWQTITGGGGGGGDPYSNLQLEDESVNTSGTCTPGNIGLMRYRTTATGDRDNSSTSTIVTDANTGISFVGVSTGELNTGGYAAGSLDIAVPPGVIAGDLLIYVVSADELGAATVPPAGFTVLTGYGPSYDGRYWYVAYKISDASETTLSFSTDTTYGIAGAVLAYRGVDQVTPVSVYSEQHDPGTMYDASPWPLNATSITPTVDGSKIVMFSAAGMGNAAPGGFSFTPPAGFDERVDFAGTGNYSYFCPFTVADMTQDTAAATGAITASMTAAPDSNHSTGSILFALSPDSGSPTGDSVTTTTTIDKDISYSTYAEICNGTAWAIVGTGYLDEMSDAVTNYTAAPTASTGSYYSMFLGSGAGGAVAGAGQYNTALGYQSINNHSGSSDYNTAMGYQALRGLTGGADYNTAFGYQSMLASTSGQNNTAFGAQSLLSNTTASDSTAFGYQALMSHVNQEGNLAVGAEALKYYNIRNNTAVGYRTLKGGSIVVGNNNGEYQTAVGANALENMASGNAGASSALGSQALAYITGGGGRNTACGYAAGAAVFGTTTSPSIQTACGSGALKNSISGDSVTAVGSGAMENAVTPYSNLAVGYRAMYDLSPTTEALNVVAVGWQAFYGAGVGGQFENLGNVAVGATALYSGANGATGVTAFGSGAAHSAGANPGTQPYQLTAFGYDAAYYAGTEEITAVGAESQKYAYDGAGATGNTSVGYQSLMGSPIPSNNTGNDNTAAGYQALRNITSGSSNVGVGYRAGINLTTGSSNVAIGPDAMYGVSTGIGNVAIGRTYSTYAPLYSMNASYTVAIGNDALARATGSCSGNVVIGHSAMYGSAGCGDNNVAIGYHALYSNTTGQGNVAVGSFAGSGTNASGASGVAVTTESYNTFIGYDTQLSSAGYTNSTAIGNGAQITGSNRIVLGNTSITGIYAQVTSITAISDRRHKKDIQDMDLGLSFINTLHPVSYRFNSGDDTLRYGLIAQEVEASLPDTLKPLVGKGEKGLALLDKENNAEKTYRLNYFELLSPIVKAVQELDDKFEKAFEKFEAFLLNAKDQIAKFAETFADIESNGKVQNKKMDAIDKELKSLEKKLAVAK